MSNMFGLTPGMTAGSVLEFGVEPAALTDSRRYGHGVPLMIPASQVYYWERVWQEGEAESAAERAAGRGERFGSSGELVRWLLTPEG